MKPRTKTIINIAMLLMVCAAMKAQNNKASYFYDSNGNRTNATVILMSQSQTSPAPTVEEKLDIDQQTSLTINIFPNPTRGELRVELTGVKLEQLSAPNNSIKIWDINGSFLFSIRLIGESNIVDISKYSNGIYIMQLLFMGETKNYKIIKE